MHTKVEFTMSDLETFLVVILIITIVIGPVLGKSLNWLIPPRVKVFFYKRAIKDNDFDKLFLKSVERQMPLLLTMASRKVYVGWILQTTNPSKDHTEITILPIMSGYATQKRKKIKFTTYYDKLYDKILLADDSEGVEDAENLNHLNVDDFEVVLPFPEIISGRLFDLKAFYEFSNQ